MKSTAEEVGLFFKGKRLAARIDLEHVREYLSLESTEVLKEYEAGTRKIALDHMLAFSNLYGISPDELVKFLYDVGVSEAPQAKRRLAK